MLASACAVVLPAIPEDAVLLMVLWRKVHSTGRRFWDLTKWWESIVQELVLRWMEVGRGAANSSSFHEQKSTSTE